MPSQKKQWENEIFGNFQDIWSEKYPTLPLGINLIPLATYNLKISSYWYDSLISVHFLYKSSWETFQKFVKLVHPVEAVTKGPFIYYVSHFEPFWAIFYPPPPMHEPHVSINTYPRTKSKQTFSFSDLPLIYCRNVVSMYYH